MGRRRKQLIDDSDPDSSSGESDDLDDPDDLRQGHDPDRDAEEDLFRDPYQTGRRKRRRRNDDGWDAKEDAIYGTFAHASDDEARGRSGGGGRGRGRGRGGGASSASLRRPQAFVSSTTTAQPSNPVEDAPPLADVDAEAENAEATMDISSGSSADSDDSNADADDDEVGPAEEAAPDDLPDPVAKTGLGAATSHAGLGSSSRVGLGASSASPAASANYAAAKMFAKAGLGSRTDAGDEASTSAGRSGLGSGGGKSGLGASAGLGSGGRTGLGGGGLGLGGGAHRSIRQLMEEQAPSPASPASSGENTPAASTSERRSFLGATPPPAATTSGPPKPAFKLSRDEERHFAKISSSSSVGAKLLAKMGWTSGSGLGAKGEGIVTPIESKLRPKGAGLNYGGFGERTKQAKEEDRRKGKVVSDEEEEGQGRRRKGNKLRTKLDASRGGTPSAEKRPDAWKRPAKAKKPSVVHKTYEEVLASGGTISALDGGIGQIVDLTGQALPSLPSTLSMNVTAPTEEDKRSLPELRHNLRLLCDTAKAEVQGLAKEGQALQERKRWAAEEVGRAKQRRAEQEQKRKRLEEMVVVAKEVADVSRQAAGVDEEAEKLLERFEEPFDRLLGRFEKEYDEMRLDEVAVAGIAPILRRTWVSWQPLEEPTFLVSRLKRWRKILRLQKDVDPHANGIHAVDIYGAPTPRSNGVMANSSRTMTAFETLLWTQWLPRVRSAVNLWSPADAQPLVDLFVAWRPLLPRFLQDNIFDQLILPKLSTAIADWSPRAPAGSASLHAIVFPWLEHAGEGRMEDILDQAKRRVRSWLGAWKAREGVPKGLAVWKEVYPKKEWDSLMLKTVVPTLGAYLRDHFKVDPRNQDLAPLRLVFPWRPLLRTSIFTQLLQTGFFSKWLDALWIWLTHSPDYDQINAWFAWWRSEISEDVASMRAVEDGFARGTEMVHQARSLSSLGMSIKERLARPDLEKRPLGSSSRVSSRAASPGVASPRKAVPAAPSRQVEEVTFRSIVEEEAAKANLILLPTGKSLETTGAPLFRVSKNVDGKNGVTIYMEDDVVYVQEAGEWEPMMVEDMLAKAQG